MSSSEIIVGLVFVLLGYWGVSVFLERKSKSQASGSPAAPQTWPAVLNVPATASVAEIRAAYQTLMSQYHPDKVASLGTELRELAERKSREITAAYRDAMRSHGVD